VEGIIVCLNVFAQDNKKKNCVGMKSEQSRIIRLWAPSPLERGPRGDNF